MRPLAAAISALAVLTTLSAASAASQTATAADLGRTAPRTANLSLSPSWRAYAFDRDGVRYIQINDAAGTVHAAFATQGGGYLVLPLGTDAERVIVPPSANALAAGSGELIYKDGAVQVELLQDTNGVGYWIVRRAEASTPPVSSAEAQPPCTGAGCSGNTFQALISPPVQRMASDEECTGAGCSGNTSP